MYEEELAFALQLADRADQISLDLFTRGGFAVRHKADDTPVTEADERIEETIREALGERFPNDAVLGEEGGAAGTGSRVWVVDPIDGTKNFTDGLPIWGTLIALQVDGVGVVGVVSAPALRERWDAAAGMGARCNGGQIHVSTTTELDSSFVTYGDLERWVGCPDRDQFFELAAQVRRTRGVGDFWAHLLVARGNADICVERELRIWDWAACDVIVREAGGSVTTVLSTNGLLHGNVVSRFRD